jgi:hypothetical protein
MLEAENGPGETTTKYSDVPTTESGNVFLQSVKK